MAYSPPLPGRTEAGQPTPEDVPKQDAKIRELPPEIRRNFLLSMVFFPSIVGAGICGVLFLGWWFLRDAKTPEQYAKELREGIVSGTQRSRWRTARQLAENISDPRLHHPAILAALLKIVEDPALDEEVVAGWTPSELIRKPDERRRHLRWYAAYLAGHLAGILGDPRGRVVLTKALNETNAGDPKSAAGLRYFAAAGLGLMKDLAAADSLAEHLAHDPDSGVRAICAKSLGTIGWHNFFSQEARTPDGPGLERIRGALRHALKSDASRDVTLNAAVALARVKDAAGRATLEKLLGDKNALFHNTARRALAILDAK